ncbi:hypothetical protein Tco_1515506 [Tanacetum coccineum]
MRKRMKALRLQGVATRLNYSSEDVYKEREMEAPPEIRSQPSDMIREPITGNIPPLLASHMRTLSPRGATGVNGDPPSRYRNDEGSPSPLIRWIEEFQLLDVLRIPLYVGYHDRKGDLDDFHTRIRRENQDGIMGDCRSYSSHQEYTAYNHCPPNQIYHLGVMYYVGCLEGGYRNDEGSLSPLIRWIKEFQLPDVLRIPSYVGYHDGMGDPDDFHTRL